MASIDHLADRHSVIAETPGVYLSFPDIALAADDTLVCVYRESDGHYPTYQKLLVRTSTDLGTSWSEPQVLNDQGAHCPRISRLMDGTADEKLVIIDDGFPKSVYLSANSGATWDRTRIASMLHVIPDRILTVDDGALFTTGHFPRGEAARPTTGQPPCEQMCFVSTDMGATWSMRSVLAYDPFLVFCEASVTRLTDGRLLALLRENSGVFEPLYACLSADEGRTWTDPAPTPIIGHRPCAGVVPGGRLLVTYRDVSPDPGTAAWLGTLDELLGGFEVHATNNGGAKAAPDGLRFCGACAERFALRPLTDPATARAALEAQVRVDEGEFGLRLGAWFTVGTDYIKPMIKGARRLKIEPGRTHRIRLDYEGGQVTVRVDGRKKRTYDVAPDRMARPVIVGAMPGAQEPLRAHVAGLRHATREPRHLRTHDWSWNPGDPVPGMRANASRLLLRSGGDAWGGDYGYSGWVQTGNDAFLCAYHHAVATHADYSPTYTSHVALTRFSIDDFE